MLKFDYPEDYTGTNLNHRIINEKRTLTDTTSRVVTLDYGSFFVESLVVRNVATARPINPGRDFACVELDTLATEKSGKQVSQTILILNKQVTDIEIDYIFVGGQHMTGLHLIKNLKEVYPNGLEPKYHWDTTLNKPEAFKPKEHQTHVMELYGLDGVNKSIKDIIDALGFKEGRQANITFANVMKKLNEMNVQLDEFIVDTEDLLDKAFDDFRVQDNEFIFTNSAENPAVKRGYGNWVLVRNTILKGSNSDNTYVIGNDAVISLGTKQVINNVYVWKNQNSSKAATYTISSPTHDGLGAAQRNEEQDIIFNISTTNLAAGTKLGWVIIDRTTKEVISGHLTHTPITGDVVLDAQGKAQVTAKFKAITNAAALNRDYVFRLISTSNAVYNFTVIDSSLEKRIEVAFSIDSAGLYPVVRVEEGQEFFLQIKYIGNWQRGEIAILDWSASAIDFERLVSGGNPAPRNIVVPSSPTETYSLEVLPNSLIDAKQTLLVYALINVGDVINSTASYASVEVNDSSRFNYAAITFNNKSLNLTNVGRVDEDVLFDIIIETNTPNTELNIVYNTTKPIKDFSGLLSTVRTDTSGRAVISAATSADFLTNIGSQSITVSVEVEGKVVGYNTLFINDTSKTPNYQVFFSRANVADIITEINEGEKFYLNIKVDGWQVGARSPSLEFNYILDEDNGTTTTELKSRIASTLYPAMLFDSSSATYNEVTWINGNTLRFEYTAIADKLVRGDTKLTTRVKQSNQSQFDKAANLIIRDTSIPTVVGTWSSSAVVLTPISAVDEMQTNGLDQRCYLWIDVDGDGGSFGDITLTSNSSNGVDFVTLFPNAIRLGNGVSRYIVTVDAKSDFIAEGNKTLFVAGSYKNSRNQDVELFRSSITLVDNSILTALDSVASVSPTNAVATNGFSEWVPFYMHLTYPAFAFDSQIEWRVVFTNNPSNGQQLAEVQGVIEVPRNTPKSVLTLTPIKDRLKDGESTFTFYYRRKIKATGQFITTEKTMAGVRILDDSLPTALEFEIFSDAARTVPIGTNVNEGTKLYLRAIVRNPDRPYSVSFGMRYASTTVTAITGVSGDMLVLGSSSIPAQIQMDDRKIVSIVPATAGVYAMNIYAEMTVVADRTTAANAYAASIEVRAYDNSNNSYPVDSVAAFNSTPHIRAVKEFAINDTSKTAIYNVVAPSSVNEDTSFRLEVTVADGTIGDVYYPTLLSGIAASRFSINELGLEQLASTAISSHNWNFKVAPDYKTTGPINLSFAIMNKTTGKQVATKVVVLNDSHREPDLQLTMGPSWTAQPLPEGDTVPVRIHASNDQLYTGDTVKIEWLSGRAASEFTGLFGNFTVDGNRQVVTNVVVRKDRRTNTAAENVVVVRVTSSFSGTSKQFTININDTSQTPAIRNAVWKNANTGAVITQANEGDTIRLEVLADGGTDAYGLTLTNDGGRSIGRLDSHEYGAKKTRANNTTAVVWVFKIKIDYQTNTGVDTLMKVRLISDAGNINEVYSLPIYDNSKSTTASINFTADNSTSTIASAIEGAFFGIDYRVSQPDPDATYRLLTYSSRAADGWELDVTYNLGQFTSLGNDQYQFKAIRKTSFNTVTNTSGQLQINAELWDVKNNRLLATSSLAIIDVGRNPINAADIRICNRGEITHTNYLNEGVTAEIYLPAFVFTGVDWSKESMRVVLTGNVALSYTTFSIGANNRQADGSFRASFAIPANEATASGEQSIFANLEHLFIGVSGSYLRGTSNKTIINDTSMRPYIRSVFFAENADIWSPSGVAERNEGSSFYLHVWANALTLNNEPVTVALSWDGTASAADFTTPLPSSIVLNVVNANERDYRGVAGPFTIVADNADG